MVRNDSQVPVAKNSPSVLLTHAPRPSPVTLGPLTFMCGFRVMGHPAPCMLSALSEGRRRETPERFAWARKCSASSAHQFCAQPFCPTPTPKDREPRKGVSPCSQRQSAWGSSDAHPVGLVLVQEERVPYNSHTVAAGTANRCVCEKGPIAPQSLPG